MEWLVLMIVVAIIGILAAIAIPAYQDYTRKAGDKACLGEAKGIANAALIAFSEQETLTAPVWKACDGDNAANVTVPAGGAVPSAAPTFKIKAELPGTALISCGPTSSCEIE